MSFAVPPSSSQGLAGAQSAAQQVSQARELRKEPTKSSRMGRAEDEVIMGAEAVERADGVKPIASNDQEEAREDHQQHEPGAYGRDGKASKQGKPRLDLNG